MTDKKALPWKELARKYKTKFQDAYKMLQHANPGADFELVGSKPEGDGKFSVEFASNLIGSMTVAFSSVLEENPGTKNYLEMSFSKGGEEELYRCVIIRPGGESPHRLRKRAELQLKEAFTALEVLGKHSMVEHIKTLDLSEEQEDE